MLAHFVGGKPGAVRGTELDSRGLEGTAMHIHRVWG